MISDLHLQGCACRTEAFIQLTQFHSDGVGCGAGDAGLSGDIQWGFAAYFFLDSHSSGRLVSLWNHCDFALLSVTESCPQRELLLPFCVNFPFWRGTTSVVCFSCIFKLIFWEGEYPVYGFKIVLLGYSLECRWAQGTQMLISVPHTEAASALGSSTSYPAGESAQTPLGTLPPEG